MITQIGMPIPLYHGVLPLKEGQALWLMQAG